MKRAIIIASILIITGVVCFSEASYHTLIESQAYPQKPVLDSYGGIDNTAFPKRTLSNDTQEYHVVQMGGPKPLFITSMVLLPAGVGILFYKGSK